MAEIIRRIPPSIKQTFDVSNATFNTEIVDLQNLALVCSPLVLF
jgi:hypothetical protein